MTPSGNVDTTTLGLYEITYTTTYYELDYEVVRYVIVVDQIPPEVSLIVGVDTILVNEDWIDSGIEAIDNSNGEVTVTVTGIVDNTTVGTYIVIYSATDESDNTSTITRVVTVME